MVWCIMIKLSDSAKMGNLENNKKYLKLHFSSDCYNHQAFSSFVTGGFFVQRYSVVQSKAGSVKTWHQVVLSPSARRAYP
jgi:hypothetical protein